MLHCELVACDDKQGCCCELKSSCRPACPRSGSNCRCRSRKGGCNVQYIVLSKPRVFGIPKAWRSIKKRNISCWYEYVALPTLSNDSAANTCSTPSFLSDTASNVHPLPRSNPQSIFLFSQNFRYYTIPHRYHTLSYSRGLPYRVVPDGDRKPHRTVILPPD